MYFQTVARLFHGRDHLADEALRHEENATSRLNFLLLLSFNLQCETLFFGGPFFNLSWDFFQRSFFRLVLVKEPPYEAPETNCGYLHRGLVLNLVRSYQFIQFLNRIGERLSPKLRLGQLGLVELYTLTGFVYSVLSECLT